MDIRRTVVAGAIGLALVAGGIGCGGSDEKGSDETPPTVPDEATGPSSTDWETVDADGDGEADLPPNWPADFVLPERAKLARATSLNGQLYVGGTIDGELDVVTAELSAVMEAAGFFIYEEIKTPEEDQVATTTRSIDDEYDVMIVVADVASAPEGQLTFNLTLEAEGQPGSSPR